MNRLFKVSSVISQSPIILYSSNELLTMSDNSPIGANSVVVQEGKIVDLGKKETLIVKYLSHLSFTIDEQFEDKIITPDFVEPHLHLWLSDILLGSEFITPAGRLDFSVGRCRGYTG
ncbi:hypothetical protein [Aliivibrio logei]|jgi:hypothetical protein|uniref:hypothetical protein n=1 Tax=Aliivibrio logei TaxID=688 RepID=UPI0035C92E2C